MYSRFGVCILLFRKKTDGLLTFPTHSVLPVRLIVKRHTAFGLPTGNCSILLFNSNISVIADLLINSTMILSNSAFTKYRILGIYCEYFKFVIYIVEFNIFGFCVSYGFANSFVLQRAINPHYTVLVTVLLESIDKIIFLIMFANFRDFVPTN